MAILPILQIIFYLAVMFAPAGTKSLALTEGWNQKITWTLQDDGTWKAANASGGDMGAWSAKDGKVSVTRDGNTVTTDVSPFVKVETAADQTKTATVEGKPLTVAIAENGDIHFSQPKDGLFTRTMTITPGK
ncbi:MAG TPA: hypothetical protein VG733_14285 [Chthoniobacteraceae bacterium]|nr:hypothetical protein [Chthoniobacteraceae bacterium]